jgi:hypothetical protein
VILLFLEYHDSQLFISSSSLPLAGRSTSTLSDSFFFDAKLLLLCNEHTGGETVMLSFFSFSWETLIDGMVWYGRKFVGIFVMLDGQRALLPVARAHCTHWARFFSSFFCCCLCAIKL